VADLTEGSLRPDAPDSGGLPGQELGLVIAPDKSPPGADGDVGDRVEAAGEVLRRSLDDIPGEHLRPPGFALEFHGPHAGLHGPVVVEGHRAGVAPLSHRAQDLLRRDEGEDAVRAHALAGTVHERAAEGAPGREEEVKKQVHGGRSPFRKYGYACVWRG
jgi:hypothetical protein